MENPKGGPLGAEEAVYAIYPKVYMLGDLLGRLSCWCHIEL